MGSNKPFSDYVGEDDLGSIFLAEDGSVWRMVAHCREPQATFERLSPSSNIPPHGEPVPQRVTHVVGCLNHNAMGLRKLVPHRETLTS